MAVSRSVACDPVASWYQFAYPLSWSDNCEVAQVLADIPFISVGVLVLGVSLLLLLAVKCVSQSALCLLVSAFLAFVAAILDLAKTLADEVATGVASEPFIRAREILLAFSVGFRFLFYWSYVAEPPRKHLSAASARWLQRMNFRTLDFTDELHSGSWMRWGSPGKLLGIGLLVAIMIIPALQIAWRVIPPFHQYTSVYAMDAVLELLVSFLLLLKMLLNTITSKSPGSMLMHTSKECLAPISGLLVNIATGVGTLLCFAFAESTVGRLLQAFEFYVIVVFVVVTAFVKHRDAILHATPTLREKRRDPMFTLPVPVRGSTFRITPPFVETPRMSTIHGAAAQNMESSREVLRRSAHRSLNHVSSWVSSRVLRNRSRYEDEDVKLWNAERVKVDPPYTGNIEGMDLRASVVSSTQESKGWGEVVHEAPVNHMSTISALDVQSMEGSVHSGLILHSPRRNIVQRTTPPEVRESTIPATSVLPSVSSGKKHVIRMEMSPQESPGDGVPDIRLPTSASDSRTSLDELLRQQSQLDQSIEALRLFSTGVSTDSSHSNSILSPKGVELTRSFSTGQRTVSSDVSLSNFPVPPWLTTPVPSLPPSPSLSTIKRIRGDRRVRLAAARTAPIQDTCSSVSPETPAEFFSRPDLGGTQLIGGLATPDEARYFKQGMPCWPTEGESSVGTVQTSSRIRRVPPRILLVPPPRRLEGLPVGMTPPVTPSSGLSKGEKETPADAVEFGTNDQISYSPTIALSPPTPVTGRVERGTLGTPPITAQQLQAGTTSAERAGRVERMFARPRPPPLAIRPDAGQRAEVRTGD